jgi:hypothetical protein
VVLDVVGGVRGRPVPKTFFISKGSVGSGTVETFTLSSDSNVINLVQNYGSVTGSRSYVADFTAGLPTEIGSVLLLEISSSRTNSDSVTRAHATEIAFNGTVVLTTETVPLAPGGSYSRKLRRTLILTVDGWRDAGLKNIQSNTRVNETIFTSGDSYTERMRIDSAGNVGIGTSSPQTLLHLEAPLIGQSTPLIIGNISATGNGRGAAVAFTGGAGVTFGTLAGFFSGTDQQLRLFSTGTTFVRAGGTGGVFLSPGATAWSAISDERLKTALIPFKNAVEKVCTLRAGTGSYLGDAQGVSRSFLIAQDVQKVLPEAVHVQEDEVGTLSLRYTDTIPLLVAAIQEQQAIINDLKTRLDAANL